MDLLLEQYSTNENKLIEIKNKIEIFKTLTDAELLDIICDIEFVRYKKDNVIIRKNEISDDIFFILSGECAIDLDTTTFILEAGSVVGEIAPMFDLPRRQTVLTHSDNVALLKFKIDKENIRKNCPAFAKLFYELSKQLNEKLEISMRRLTEIW